MKTRSKYIVAALIALWLVGMLSLTPEFLRLHAEAKDALQTVSVYSDDLVGNRYNQAYQYSSEAFRAALPFDQFVTLYSGLTKQYGSLKTVSRRGYQVNGHGSPMAWKAIVDEDFAYEKKTLRFEFVLHKENGRWVIFSAEEL